jgi:hypothetical protein
MQNAYNESPGAGPDERNTFAEHKHWNWFKLMEACRKLKPQRAVAVLYGKAQLKYSSGF